MPYLSEELYQRLPKPNGGVNSPPSLCVTPYPKSNEVKIFFSFLFFHNFFFSFSLINIVMKQLREMLTPFMMLLKKFVHIVQPQKLFQRKKILVSLLRSCYSHNWESRSSPKRLPSIIDESSVDF